MVVGEAGDPGGPAGITAGRGEQGIPPNSVPARDVLRYWRIMNHGLKKRLPPSLATGRGGGKPDG